MHGQIIIVEEETPQRDAIAEHLSGHGFLVLHAADTDEALEHLETREAIGGLVADAHVPGDMSAHALAERVRRDWPHVAVVLISGHSDESSGPVPEGCAFCAKPSLFENLAPILRRMMDRARA